MDVSNFSDICKIRIDSHVGVSVEALLSNMTLSGDDKMTLTTAEELVPARQESENLRVFTEPAFFHPLEQVVTLIEKPYYLGNRFLHD